MQYRVKNKQYRAQKSVLSLNRYKSQRNKTTRIIKKNILLLERKTAKMQGIIQKNFQSNMNIRLKYRDNIPKLKSNNTVNQIDLEKVQLFGEFFGEVFTKEIRDIQNVNLKHDEI